MTNENKGWKRTEDGIRTPSLRSIPIADDDLANHVFDLISELVSENEALKLEKANHFADTYEQATLQAEHDHHQHAQVRMSRIRDHIRNGYKLADYKSPD